MRQILRRPDIKLFTNYFTKNSLERIVDWVSGYNQLFHRGFSVLSGQSGKPVSMPYPEIFKESYY